MTTLMLVWTVEISCWLILVRPCVICCWLSWPLALVTPSDGRKLTCIIMVAICHLRVKYGHRIVQQTYKCFNPLNPELNPICYLLALLGAHYFLHVSSIRVKSLTFRLLMSYIYIYIYIYGAPILDVSRSHTTTQHSR